MFESQLVEKLKNIFDLDKVTFDSPSESQEQECLFVEVESSKNSIKNDRQIAKVTGKIRVFCDYAKFPYGYFSKCIHEADVDDTKNLFFYEIEQNHGTIGNICERTVSFIFLFDSQYDPEHGTMTSINLNEAES